MSQEKKHPRPAKKSRREFLANLLFTGVALTASSFQEKLEYLAATDPKEGWELPDDLESNESADGWSLPEGLLDSPSPAPRPKCPRPRPRPRPYPMPPGGVRPPHARGKFVVPPPSPEQ